MNRYDEIADGVIVNKIRVSWLEISKMYNEMAVSIGGTMSMAFVLLTINERYGTPVTKIAPRMGMEPNSLSRILKSLEDKGAIYKRKDPDDKRKVYVCLSDFGMELREIAFKRLFDFENSIHEKIPADKMKIFFEVLNAIPEIVSEFREKKNK
ncbi:MarR family transcriptional regulator [Flavobacteriales bacterium]|jgi:MarR family transcriptional regulator, organic hydroperoxide resistance regulator|nr:MarR family transcriptional regulator [Flavobacteriales bacterium]